LFRRLLSVVVPFHVIISKTVRPYGKQYLESYVQATQKTACVFLYIKLLLFFYFNKNWTLLTIVIEFSNTFQKHPLVVLCLEKVDKLKGHGEPKRHNLARVHCEIILNDAFPNYLQFYK